jgi:cell filamentation protein
VTGFDVFGDAGSHGYLRNVAASNDLTVVHRLEQASFERNIDRAVQYLQDTPTIRYRELLDTHAILFGDVYPWAGQDRTLTAPNLEISRGGYRGMFADPNQIEIVAREALRAGSQTTYFRNHPGIVFEMLAHAHPFLDGNGRTITTVHAELAARANIMIDWNTLGKAAINRALTADLLDPGQHHLDRIVQPHIKRLTPGQSIGDLLRTNTGLKPVTQNPPVAQPVQPNPPEGRQNRTLK